jgi:polar amino acid transport system substrate-binding protein
MAGILSNIRKIFVRLPAASCILVSMFFVQCIYASNGNIIEIRTIAIAPYGFESSAQPSGIYFDLANQLSDESGFKTTNLIYPYARIIKELRSGETDLTIMFKYKELSDDVIYIAPLPTLQNVVIGLAGTRIDAIGDLKGKIIGYLRGAKFSDVIDNDPDIYKYEIRDYFQGLGMLKSGRVYAIIGPIDPILSATSELGDNISILGKPFVVSERTPWVQMSKKSKHIATIETLKKHITKILARGDLDLLRKKYITGL